MKGAVLSVFSLLGQLMDDERGQGMVEYGLIIALVAIAVIGVVTAMGGQLQSIFQTIVDTLTGVTGG
mgnify:CR=1 FL=1